MGSDYSRLADSYDRWRDRRELVDDWAPVMLREGGFPSGGRLVEVGCGTGVWLAAFRRLDPQAFALGVEPESAMLTRAGGKGLGCLLRGRGEALPVRTGGVDLVAFLFSLHHFDDPLKGLAEAHRVARAAGRVVVLTRSHSQLEESVLALFPGVLEVDRGRFPRLERLERHAEALGLRVAGRVTLTKGTPGHSVEEWVARARGGFISTFQHLSETQRREGLVVFERRLRGRYGEEVVDRSGFTLLVFQK